MAVDATAMLGVRSDSTPRQNGASARDQQLPAAADMIRASVKNRVDNGVPGASVAIHGRHRSERSRAVLLTVACRGANSRSASVHRRPIDQGQARPMSRRDRATPHYVQMQNALTGPHSSRDGACQRQPSSGATYLRMLSMA